MDGNRVQSACYSCNDSKSPCSGQIPCHRCVHYTLNCNYPSRAQLGPACLECSRKLSECDRETPCQHCSQLTLQCVYPTLAQLERRANASAVVASQSGEVWPEQISLRSRSRERETRPTAAGGSLGANQRSLGGGEARQETREPDSYFIKEHNRGIDEDHLAKFKPDKKWKVDRVGLQP